MFNAVFFDRPSMAPIITTAPTHPSYTIGFKTNTLIQIKAFRNLWEKLQCGNTDLAIVRAAKKNMAPNLHPFPLKSSHAQNCALTTHIKKQKLSQ